MVIYYFYQEQRNGNKNQYFCCPNKNKVPSKQITIPNGPDSINNAITALAGGSPTGMEVQSSAQR